MHFLKPTKRYKRWLAIIFVILAVPAGCNLLLFPKISDFNYRLTLNFEDGNRQFSETGVSRAILTRQWCPLSGMSCVSSSFRGEAIPVQFSNGSWVFVLMGALGPHSERIHAFTGYLLQDHLWRLNGHSRNYELNSTPGISWQLPREDFPGIIFFSDLTNPRTAKWVNPDSIGGVVAPLSGETIRLLSVTAEVTTEPVTWKLEKLLPWLANAERRDVSDGNENVLTREMDPGFLWYMLKR
ncbi:Hypothetical protein NGAL_HAMBI2605_20920 [Neorhizobium galegae bv. orientalis]|nr:Hypothetical protein NGAL_HAMBI2605_20920 [Neorhizobium galegae bv. orientalis]